MICSLGYWASPHITHSVSAVSKPFQYHALGVKPSRIPSTEKYTIEKNETMTGMPEATHDWCFSAPHHSHLVTPLSDQPKLEPASTHASYEFFPIAITKKISPLLRVP